MGWYNSDGLYIKFGTDEATVGKAGSYEFDGPQRYLELIISPMTGLGTAAAIQSDSVIVPAGAVIQEVHTIANTACTSGGSAVLNVGLIKTDRTTEIDYDGIIAAAALTTIDATGEITKLVKGSTGAGALIGTTIGANPGLLTADYDTAAFTAGKVTIRIFYTLNAP
jgi:hypothetical protein